MGYHAQVESRDKTKILTSKWSAVDRWLPGSSHIWRESERIAGIGCAKDPFNPENEGAFLEQ